MTRPVRLGIPLAVLACLLAAVTPRAAAQPMVPRVRPNGTHAFRLMLHGSKLQPLQGVADLAKEPGKSLLIVFGDTRVLDELDNLMGEDGRTGLESFLERGGAVLLASDRGGESGIGKTFQVKPNGDLVRNFNKELAYRGQDLCPYVFPEGHPRLFRGVQKLATNAPSYLEGRNPDGAFLARFSPWCSKGGGTPFTNRPPFAWGDTGPAGQKLILAGHGVFMNGMLAIRDNAVFAGNCIDWLTRDPAGKLVRDRVLLVEEGRVIETFDVPLKEIPNPPLPTVQRLNQLLADLEKENFFNKVLHRLLGYNGPAIVVRAALILGSLALVLYGMRRLWKARYARDSRVPLVPAAVAEGVSTETLAAQRHRGMMQEGNLWELARELARQCFAEYAGRSTTSPPPRPRVVVEDGGGAGRSLRRQVEQLWRLAYEDPARRVSPAEFDRLAATADEVKAALASGGLVLEQS